MSILAVVAAAAVQTLLTPAVYTASAKIYLSATKPPTAANDSHVGDLRAVSASDLATFVDVLGAPSVIEPLRDALNLPAQAPDQRVRRGVARPPRW